jgi:hypothetical protein
MFDRDGIEWNQMSDVMRDMYERSCVFRFCAIKNLNSKKPWKKEKSACFLWNGIVVAGGWSEIKVDNG